MLPPPKQALAPKEISVVAKILEAIIVSTPRMRGHSLIFSRHRSIETSVDTRQPA
jgi:hypothetical protein